MREPLHFLSGQETDREAGLGRAGGDGLGSLRQCQTTPFVESGTCRLRYQTAILAVAPKAPLFILPHARIAPVAGRWPKSE